MNDIVRIKGNKFGLTIMMDSQVTFSQIKKALIKKLIDTRKFFGDVRVTVTVSGREISQEEGDELLKLLNKYSDIEVICLVDDDFHKYGEKDDEIETIIDESEVILDGMLNSSFHKGTLRSGQEIVSDTSIVIIGNVNDGAKVVSRGNVVVIGKLSGYVTAGSDGNNDAFVVALQMNPAQIRIGDKFGCSDNSHQERLKMNQVNPQIAFIEDDVIVIDDISQNTYENIAYK